MTAGGLGWLMHQQRYPLSWQSKHLLDFKAADAAEKSWVVLANNRRDSQLQGRRSLYEAVLLLEREGATVVERDLGFADLCLSPTVCLCVCTEQSFQVKGFCNHHRVAASI